MSNTYEMLWDCQFCGTDKNLGLTHRFCPNCGAPQNPDARYYPSDEEKVAVHDHQYVGVDVTCPSCGELNGAAVEFCGQCGAPQTEAATAKLLDPEYRASHERFESSGSRDVVKEQFDAEMERVGVKQPEKKKRDEGGVNKILIGVIAAVIGVIAFGIFAANWTRAATVVVTGHEWERSITIQEYENFTESSWRDSPPSGDNVSINFGSCREEQRSTKRVPDGQTCETVRRDNGDGTYREEEKCTTKYREEPVYDDMCTWSGQRWETDRTESLDGDLSTTPAYPNVTLNCENQRRVGCERISDRDERYTVFYRDNEESNDYRCNYDQSTWQSIPPKSTWEGEVRIVAGGLVCDSLTRR